MMIYDVYCRTLAAGILVAAGLLVACGSQHRLAEYDFTNRSLAVVYAGAPYPELYTGGYDVDTDDPIRAAIEAGARVAKEVEARRARARLDSAAAHVDVAERMADRTLERASRYLGTRPVEESASADFLLELDVNRVGIDAAGGDGARLVIDAEAILLDGSTGDEIWNVEVDGWDRLTPSAYDGGGTVGGDILTIASLSALSVEDFQRVLQRLADFSADRISNELREELRDVRRERRRR